MAISLINLLKTRNTDAAVNINETNLETGTIWAYSPGTTFGGFTCAPGDICWVSPGTGTAVIETWGAGGPGSRMCCCGLGIVGNSGAYSRKTISVTAGSYVCGSIGCPQLVSDALCFSGCSNATCICWCVGASAGQSGCICTQGGRGGLAICTSNLQTPYVCLRFGYNRCGTDSSTSAQCGIICNWTVNAGTPEWWACGFGGDINCCGTVGCTSFLGCYDACIHCQALHVPYPAGLFSNQGGTVTYWMDNADTQQSTWPGQALGGLHSALSSLSRSPKRGNPLPACWAGGRSCGCYEMQGCIAVMPIGMGGVPPTPCLDFRDHGTKGGWGGLRIKFY